MVPASGTVAKNTDFPTSVSPAWGQTGPPQDRQACHRIDRQDSEWIGPPQDRKARLGGKGTEFFIDNLLVRIHSIIEMNLLDRPCAMGIEFPFSR